MIDRNRLQSTPVALMTGGRITHQESAMQRFKKILLFIQDGIDNLSAIERATELAQENGAELKAVEVIGDLGRCWGLLPTSPAAQSAFERMKENRTGELRSMLESAAKAGVETAAEVLCGRRDIQVVREVLRSGHDLLITSAERDDEALPGLLGTTTLRLLRKCPCPVWVVKPTHRKPYRRVLAAVDVEPEEEVENGALNLKILALARSLAEMEGAPLHVVSAWESEVELALHHAIDGAELNRLLKEHRASSEEALDRLLAGAELPGLGRRVHLVEGDPAEVIPRIAEELRVELIVMGTVARTGIPGLFMGNTAEEVLNLVDCSVLALKPDGFVSPVELEDEP